MIDINNFDSITIGLASSKQIHQWSSGEVTKPETINYRTLKPEKDGLFCEKIFGPTKDWECYCGKYKRVRYKGIICERCGVEVTRAKVRRERMGHIDLAAPVSHIWFFKGVPSRIGYMLDIAPKELEKVLYFAASIVTEVDDEARTRDLADLEGQVNEAIEGYGQDREARILELNERLERRVTWLRDGKEKPLTDEDLHWIDDLRRDRTSEDPDAVRELTEDDLKQAEADQRKETDVHIKDEERYAEESVERLTAAWLRFKELKPQDIEQDEQLFREMQFRFGSPHGFGGHEYFKGGMGAEAIRELLEQIDLDEEAASLRETINTSKGQRQSRALKRLKVVSAFLKSKNRPEWMVLERVPVIPPELRPMVQLDGGRFATSDLNDLYRRVINRNNRLKRLLDLGAPEIIVNNEKRMLQEAVDALFDNGRRGRAVTGPGNRPLKSLSDMLKGKQGRFRQNLLGKRVDYSGRSVIVAGPELRLHQCGLPKLMALELFKPFIMSRLVERKQVQNIKAAKKLVESMVPEVWDVLEEVIGEHPVLLNRAPTLHRLGIQAFEPVLVEGKAVQIHPLVCTAFNADFDGDQMAVHLPLSVEAQAEARILMLSANNILSPAHGRPIAVPSQDMVLGLYYLTYCPVLEARKKGETGRGEARELIEHFDQETGKWTLPRNHEARYEGGEWSTKPFADRPRPQVFRSVESVISGLDVGAVGLQEVIELRDPRTDERLLTTPGRVTFNAEVEGALRSVVPAEELEVEPFPRNDRTLNKREVGDYIERLVNLYGPTAVSMVLDAFKALGFQYAGSSGITISKNDIVVPPTKHEILERFDEEVEEYEGYYARGEMSSEERHEQVVRLWEMATEEVAGAMEDHLYRLNPIFMMANSGARGSFKQIRQLAGMRGLMNNPKGETIERPIKSNFMEGLSVLEYFISTHGARKGLADTALKTADSGYLTRRLVDVAQDVIVREDDCGSDEGIDSPVFRDDGNVNPSLAGRVLLAPITDQLTGEVLVDPRPSEDAELQVAEEDAAGNGAEVGPPLGKARDSYMLTGDDVNDIDEACRDADGQPNENAIAFVRTPLKCRTDRGICRLCYGLSPASGEMAEEGDAVGIIAAQSIGEPGTQLTMRTFHTGGVAGADITHGLPRVVELFEARKPKKLAQVAKSDGWVRIDDDESRLGSAKLVITEAEHLAVDDAGSGATRAPAREHEYPSSKRTEILVNAGAWVEAGDMLTMGSAFPTDVLDSQSGIIFGVDGEITAVKPIKPKKGTKAAKASKEAGDAWTEVIIETDEGPVERLLRLPTDRPAPELEPGTRVTAGRAVRGRDAARERSTKTETYLVHEVQNVYRSQGVDINDKHIEVIVRQMLRKVNVEQPGETRFLPGQPVDKPVLYRANARAAMAERERLLAQREAGDWKGSDWDMDRAAETVQATFEPLILGITKASLATESFLSAASFQETTKVLTDAALEGKVDNLRGLKENVIIGKLIPAATGLRKYRQQLEIEAVHRQPALLEFDLDDPYTSEGEDDPFLSLAEGGDGMTYSFGPETEVGSPPDEES